MKRSVLVPTFLALALLGVGIALAAVPQTAVPDKNIVQVAGASKDHTTLVAALKAANYITSLQNPGPFTVFAPTNEAFAKLPKGTIETLLRPENREQLKAILTYHVVPGRISAEEAIMAKKARSVEGSSLRVGITDGALRVNSTKIITADVRASNGVIHVIDEVLLPPAARPAHH